MAPEGPKVTQKHGREEGEGGAWSREQPRQSEAWTLSRGYLSPTQRTPPHGQDSLGPVALKQFRRSQRGRGRCSRGGKRKAGVVGEECERWPGASRQTKGVVIGPKAQWLSC